MWTYLITGSLGTLLGMSMIVMIALDNSRRCREQARAVGVRI